MVKITEWFPVFGHLNDSAKFLKRIKKIIAAELVHKEYKELMTLKKPLILSEHTPSPQGQLKLSWNNLTSKSVSVGEANIN